MHLRGFCLLNVPALFFFRFHFIHCPFFGCPLAGLLFRPMVLAEQEGENLSGLSTNPDKGIFAVRENGTTCLMVEFAVRLTVPFDVLALNGIDVRNSQMLFFLRGGRTHVTTFMIAFVTFIYLFILVLHFCAAYSSQE